MRILMPTVMLVALTIGACSSSDDNEPAVVPDNDASGPFSPPLTPGQENQPPENMPTTQIPGTGGDQTPEEGPVVSTPTVTDPSTDTPDMTPDIPPSGGQGVTGDVLQIGIVTITENPMAEEVEAVAVFSEFDAPVTGSEFTANYEGLLSQDYCSLSGDDDDELIEDSEDVINDISVESLLNPISAGDVLTLASTSAGFYGELVSINVGGFSVYSTTSDLPYPAPDIIQLDIPGDQFPAFSNVQIPFAPLLTGLNLQLGDSVSSSTTMTWQSEASSTAKVVISAGTGFFNGGGELIDLECIVQDSGSFSVPADIAAQLSEKLGADWELVLDSVDRQLLQFVQQDNAVLLINRTSEI